MRAVLVAVAATLLMTGCSPTSAVVARAEQAGCRSVLVEYQRVATRTVLSLSARECRRDGAELLPAAEALDVLQRSAWQARTEPFDTIYATVYRVAEVPDDVLEQCLKPVDDLEGPYPPGDLEALKQDRRANAGRKGTTRAHRSSWSCRR